MQQARLAIELWQPMQATTCKSAINEDMHDKAANLTF